jgi:hypothetical protein
MNLVDEFLDGVSRRGRTILGLVYYIVIVFFLLLILRNFPSLRLPNGFFDSMNIVLAVLVGASLLSIGVIGLRQARERRRSAPWYKKLLLFAGVDLLLLGLLGLLVILFPAYSWLTNVTMIVLAIPLVLAFCWLMLFAGTKALEHLEIEAEEERAVVQTKREEGAGRPFKLAQRMSRGERVRGLSFLIVLLIIVASAILVWVNVLHPFLDPVLIWSFLGLVYGFLYLNAGLRALHTARQQGVDLTWYRQHDLLASLAGFLFGIFVLVQYVLSQAKVDLAMLPVQALNVVCVALIAGLIIASSVIKRRYQQEHGEGQQVEG